MTGIDDLHYLWICLVAALLLAPRSRSFTARQIILLVINLGVTFLVLRGQKEYWFALLALAVVGHFVLRWAAERSRTWGSVFLLAIAIAFFSFRLTPSAVGCVGLAFFFLRYWRLISTTTLERDDSGSLLGHLNYLLFFPCFVAGPINKPSDFEKSARSQGIRKASESFPAVRFIIIGLFLQLVAAESFAYFSLGQVARSQLAEMNRWQTLLLLYGYGFHLYATFGGYSYIALGVSKLLGIRAENNFNSPFLALNIQEFWSRWHISFTTWLKEEIFFPLFRIFNKQARLPVEIAALAGLWCTFLFAGLWHGAHLYLIEYVTFHAAGFTIFLIWRRVSYYWMSTEMRGSLLWKFVAWAITFNYISLGWAFFTNKPEALLNILRMPWTH